MNDVVQAIIDLRAAFAAEGIEEFSIQLSSAVDAEKLKAAAGAGLGFVAAETFLRGLRHSATIAGVPLSWPHASDSEMPF